MQENAVAYAEQIDALFAMVFSVIDPLDRKRVGNRLGSLLKRDSVVTPVGLRFSEMPIELLFHTIRITSTKVKRSSVFIRNIIYLRTWLSSVSSPSLPVGLLLHRVKGFAVVTPVYDAPACSQARPRGFSVR